MITGAAPSSQARSGLRVLKPGEIIFNDGDTANSLYIIQKGQIRLYKPKGKGFVEIAILRAGEVIGEMAFFDEDGSGRKRSCSASALTPVEIIEISFGAFGKTMENLNPWFKTIINTLATRLRKANQKIKELEDNQTSISYSGKHGAYEFVKSVEVMRILGTLFLVFKAHGEVKNQALVLNRKTLTIYTSEMYQIREVRLESVLNLLAQLGWLEILLDEEKLPNILHLKSLEVIRQIFTFYNQEKHLAEDKKLRISDKCEMLIAKMIEKAPLNPLVDIPHQKKLEDNPHKFTKMYLLSPILEEFKAKNIVITADHVDDGRNQGLFGEVMMLDGKAMVEVDFPKVQKLYPVIRFMNAVKRLNLEKAGS